MRDTELYRHLPGLTAPGAVEWVELSAEEGRADVGVEDPGRTRFAYPDCEQKLAVDDHAEQRVWWQLGSCGFLIFLQSSPRRVACPEHRVRRVRLSWAEPHWRFTVSFQRAAVDVLTACNMVAAAERLRISWDKARHLIDRTAACDLAAKPSAVPLTSGSIGKATGKGQDTITVVSDLDAATVDDIAGRHRQAGLDGYFDRFTGEQLEHVDAVAADHVGTVRRLGARTRARR